MTSPKRTYRFCDPCNKVVRIDEPECEHYAPRHRTSESVTVIFRGPDGKISIPWSPTAKCPKGFVREEVHGSHAVRRLEKELDARDLKKYRESEERRRALTEPSLNYHRERLKQIAREAKTPFERDFAKAALARQDSGYSKRYEPGNYRSE